MHNQCHSHAVLCHGWSVLCHAHSAGKLPFSSPHYLEDMLHILCIYSVPSVERCNWDNHAYWCVTYHQCLAMIYGYWFACMQCRSIWCTLCRLLFALYLVFLVCLTSSLTLASKTSDPREYHGGWDGLRLFCEIMSLLYITVVAALNSIRIMWVTLGSYSGYYCCFVLTTATIGEPNAEILSQPPSS